MKILNSIELFLEHCEYEKNLSGKTLEFYRIDLLQLKDFLETLDVRQIGQIEKNTLKLFVQNLSRFEPRTVKRKIASAKAYLNFLEFEDYIVVNPFRKIKIRIREPQQLPSVLEFDEIKGLFMTLKREAEKITNKKSYIYGEKLRDLSVLEFLFATGVRVSELCGLRLCDINLKSGNVLVRGKGNKERFIQICNPETMAVLNDYHSFYERPIKSTGFFLLAA